MYMNMTCICCLRCQLAFALSSQSLRSFVKKDICCLFHSACQFVRFFFLNCSFGGLVRAHLVFIDINNHFVSPFAAATRQWLCAVQFSIKLYSENYGTSQLTQHLECKFQTRDLVWWLCSANFFYCGA